MTSQFNFFWVDTHVTHATNATATSLSLEKSSPRRLKKDTIVALPLTRKELHRILIFKMAHRGKKKKCSLNISNIFPTFLSLKYSVNTLKVITVLTQGLDPNIPVTTTVQAKMVKYPEINKWLDWRAEWQDRKRYFCQILLQSADTRRKGLSERNSLVFQILCSVW